MSSIPARAPRNTVLLTLDVIAGVVAIAFTVVLSIVTVTIATSYNAATDADPVWRGVAVLGITAVSILGAFAGVGMFIVALLRRRLAFVWPLGAFVVVLAGFYLGTWVFSLAVGA